MNRIVLVAAAVVLFSPLLTGQPPGDRPPGGGPPGGGRRGGPGRMLRMFPLMLALDADKDGEISAEEIANAVAAPMTLDKDHDGKLAESEIAPRSRSCLTRGRTCSSILTWRGLSM